MNDFFDSTLATGERPAITATSDGARLSAELETGLKDSTQVTAYTVFAASKDARSRQIWEWGLAAVGLVLLALGAGWLYQYFIAPASAPVTPPAVAITPPPATAPATSPTTEPPAKPDVPATAATSKPEAASAKSPDEASTKTPPSTLKAPVGPATKETQPGSAEIAKATPPPQSGTTGKAGGLAPGTEWGSMSIERDRPEQPVANSLLDAYQAFRSGNIGRAEELYRQVLRSNPDQRDALLGMAAVATKRGDKQAAIGHYQHLLQMDPSDSIANAAIYNLQGATDGASASETRLKGLIDQDPNSAHLQFTLGNVYAQQGRWVDAQNAYFRALNVDKTNPDYAYNLAVSLDRLGQGKTAILYYRRALELARQQNGSFNDTEVNARIQTLSSQRAAPY
jgi:tetratricopeptide (TPR) repeat protein